MSTMTTMPPTVEGWYWLRRKIGGQLVIVYVNTKNHDDPWITMSPMRECQLSDIMFRPAGVLTIGYGHTVTDAQWSVDPITPPSDTALSLSEQCVYLVDAALQAAAIKFETRAVEIAGEMGKLCHFSAKRDYAAGQLAEAENCAAIINSIDRATLVKHVLSLLAESPDNPDAPVDMGDA